MVVLVKIEISDMLRSGELGSARSGMVERMAVGVVEVCKFSLSSRIAPHVGRGDAKVHFEFQILQNNHQVGLHQVTGSFIKFLEESHFQFLNCK